jgi:hypothetical protein
MKRVVFTFLFILTITCLLGCSSKQDLEEVKNAGQNYYETMIFKDYNAVVKLFSPEFFTKTPEADALKLFQTIDSKLGDIQSYTLTNWNIRNVVSNKGSYTLYSLNYDTVYSKGTAKEILNFRKDAKSPEIKMLGFNIDSLDLLIN